MAGSLWEVIEHGSADDVVKAVGSRIARPDWDGSLDGLREPERLFQRVYSFCAAFANGGIVFVLEVGGPYGLEETAAALVEIGVPRVAAVLRDAQVLIEQAGDDGRADLLERLCDDEEACDALEEPAWAALGEVLPALAAYIRRNRGAFSRLADREPYDPVEVSRRKQRSFAEKRESCWLIVGAAGAAMKRR